MAKTNKKPLELVLQSRKSDLNPGHCFKTYYTIRVEGNEEDVAFNQIFWRFTAMRNINKDIKDLAKSRGVYLYEIGLKLGISAESFTKRLRKPLTDAQRKEIIAFIDEIADENATNV